MRTLKITLALAAIVALTISGVQSNEVATDNPTFNQSSKHVNLLAHKKAKLKTPSNQ